VLIAPDTYGLTGTVVRRWPLSVDVATVARELDALRPMLRFVGKTPRPHIDGGVRGGFSWQSLLPSTDPNGPRRR
jgi:hypothetical protein